MALSSVRSAAGLLRAASGSAGAPSWLAAATAAAAVGSTTATTTTLRGFAADAAPPKGGAGAAEFKAARKAYQEKVHEIRKEFAKEVKLAAVEREKAKAAASKARRAASAAATAERDVERKRIAAANVAKFQELVAAKAGERIARREQHVHHEEAMRIWLQKQKKYLEDQSMAWVEEDELEQRINEALDNPRKLT